MHARRLSAISATAGSTPSACGQGRSGVKSEPTRPSISRASGGLQFGNGGQGASPNSLYFTAGINEEQDGLFGSIVNVDN